MNEGGAEEQSDDAEDEEERDKDQTGVNVVPHDNEADVTCFLLRPMRKNPVRQNRLRKMKTLHATRLILTLSASSSVETESGIHTRGQIAAYAGIVLSMSFRKHFSPCEFLVDTLVSFAGTVEGPLSLVDSIIPRIHRI